MHEYIEMRGGETRVKHALSHVKMDARIAVSCPVAPSRFEFREMRHGQLLTRLLVPGPKHALSRRLGDEATKKRNATTKDERTNGRRGNVIPGGNLNFSPSRISYIYQSLYVYTSINSISSSKVVRV